MRVRAAKAASAAPLQREMTFYAEASSAEPARARSHAVALGFARWRAIVLFVNRMERGGVDARERIYMAHPLRRRRHRARRQEVGYFFRGKPRPIHAGAAAMGRANFQ